MKLLKYVMTHDSGLAPNPYFGVCSLALCTPNHRNANLNPGDWVVGHSSKSTGRRLVYAMRLTKILSMDEYFEGFPDKRPMEHGSIEQQYGDNMYFRQAGRWLRVASPEHNTVEAFEQDQGRRVYLAEGVDSFWYFGAAHPLPELCTILDQFPWLIQDRQGFGYVRDVQRIQKFVEWLLTLGQGGLLGKPRDQRSRPLKVGRYLEAIDPVPVWRDDGLDVGSGRCTTAGCRLRCARQRGLKRGC